MGTEAELNGKWPDTSCRATLQKERLATKRKEAGEAALGRTGACINPSFL